MSSFYPPLREINFTLKELVGTEAIAVLPGKSDFTEDMIGAILEEAGHIAKDILAPLNREGDLYGANLDENGIVHTAPGWKEAWKAIIDGRWNGLASETSWGGMGLPNILNTAVQELWQSANMAFSLCPMLTQGAAYAIQLYGSDELKAAYLPDMVSGVWTGTMNLTESQAGSDLAAIRSKAVPDGNHYKISGQKIFITYGDQDLTENIIHLVLARLPDAPDGVKGISLFLVPKFLLDNNGKPCKLNDLRCISLENKLGIHGSPTAVMSFGDHGGATGYLIGAPHRGVEYMFSMMNHARLAIGIQGLAIAERAYQQALNYARERIQGRPAGWSEEKTPAIIEHPDVRRLLMTMKCQIEAMRSIIYLASGTIDLAHGETNENKKKEYQALADLLIPIAKGWCTETGQTLTSLGIQIHGGVGYMEETGAAQHFRDARITTIYEGTTAIQANDLVNRKIIRDDGETIAKLFASMDTQAKKLVENKDENLKSIGDSQQGTLPEARKVVDWLLATKKNPDHIAAAAVPVLEMMGILTGGYLLGKAADIASQKISSGNDPDGFYQSKITTARFYCQNIMPHIPSLAQSAIRGASIAMELENSRF